MDSWETLESVSGMMKGEGETIVLFAISDFQRGDLVFTFPGVGGGYVVQLRPMCSYDHSRLDHSWQMSAEIELVNTKNGSLNKY